MRAARLATVALLMTSGACAGNPNASTSPSRDSRLIRLEEIQTAASTGIGNVYALVARLHPEWLRPTVVGVTGRAVEPVAWLDGQRLGGLATLRTVPISLVTLVRYMNPSEAQGQLGLDNLGGAIVMTSSR